MNTKYTISKNNLHIPDSYKIGKRKFYSTLAQIKGIHQESEVWKRSLKSLSREWACHNALYALHLFRSHTKDVDLNYPLKWYVKISYNVAGLIFWPWIK